MATATVGNRRLVRYRERYLPWGAAAILVMGALGYGGRTWLRMSGAAAVQASKEAEAKNTPTPVKKATVDLSAEKFAKANITLQPARFDRVATEAGVWGQISSNANRQVDVRPRAMGIVRDSKIALQGQTVTKGEVLAVLDSPDVGLSRLNLRAKQRELDAARHEADWKSEIAHNVALLIPEMQKAIQERRSAIPDDDEHTESVSPEVAKRTDTRVIEKQFADKQLGTYRGTLLQAYADFDIACHEEQKTASLRGSNIMGEHIPLVARHTREGVEAKLESTIEQARFDAPQLERLAMVALRQAEANVIDAAERLRILGVDVDVKQALSRAAMKELEQPDSELDVTNYPITAPFAGRILRRNAVPSQKADLTDVLFVIADLSTVWVTANVSESDLGKLPKLEDGAIKMTSVAYPGRVFSAKLLSVGSVVEPQNRTVPILAQTDNPDGALKVGLSMRIILDSAAGEEVLTVPGAAVVEIDAQSCVFTPDSPAAGNRSFTSRPVETGRRVGDRVEIKAGLSKGDVVVATGAFMLKSELVLKNTPEEE